jgi:hypothetical protein
MNILEKQMKLGRDLFEINTGVLRQMVELQANGVRQYFETNQQFAGKLPNVRDVSSFVEIQRDYGQALWSDVQSNFRTSGGVLKSAAENTGTALREAFSTTSAETEEAA